MEVAGASLTGLQCVLMTAFEGRGRGRKRPLRC